MSVATELTRIQGGKSSIRTSTNAKLQSQGIEIPENATIDEYSPYIDQIQTGGGGISPNYTTSAYLFENGRFTDILEDMLSYGDTSNWAYAFRNCSASQFTQQKINKIIEKLQTSALRPENLNTSYMFNLCKGDWGNLDFNFDLRNFQPTDQNRTFQTGNMFAINGASSNTPFRNITLDWLNTTSEYKCMFWGLETVRISGNLTVKAYTEASEIPICSNMYGSGRIYDFHILPVKSNSLTISCAFVDASHFNLDDLKRAMSNYTGNTKDIKIKVTSALKSLFDADADAVALAQANNITVRV